MKEHAFVRVANIQRKQGVQGTLFGCGLDLHAFGKSSQSTEENYVANMAVYGFQTGGEMRGTEEFEYYRKLVEFSSVSQGSRDNYASLLAAMERYLKFVISVSMRECGIRIFKPQFGLYVQFTVEGIRLLQRIKWYIENLANELGVRVLIILDCKPGDIMTTQAGYMTGYMDNLKRVWGIDYKPFDFDVINPTPWMGQDVLVLEDSKGNPLLGLELLRQGKCLVYVDSTSNPSGPHYQSLKVEGKREAIDRLKQLGLKFTLDLVSAADAYLLSQKYDLEEGELSQFGLVIGATHQCDGSFRRAHPTYTGINPGFGAQSVDKKDPLTPFRKLMPELIRSGPWNGQGAIFFSSRATMFAHLENYGGSGNVDYLADDIIASVQRHRELEKEAYQLPEVIDAGIVDPFRK